MFRYRGEIETNWCYVPKKVYLWILFVIICSVYMLFISILDPGLWALLSWATAVFQWRKHIIGMIQPIYTYIYIFGYYFKNHRQYPNTSTSHCYGKDDESKILPFFSLDVKPHFFCQRFVLLENLPSQLHPAKRWECLCTAANRIPIHNWQLSWLISTALSWLETRNLYTTLVEAQQKWL